MRHPRGVLASLIVALSAVAAPAVQRPAGKNCDLRSPPAEAGEEANHNSIVFVYPRRADIGPKYTGCQAVFVGLSKHDVLLAWLIEIAEGDPVRQWSPQRELQRVHACRYKLGALVEGTADVCPEASTLLMPSLPAGCVSAKPAMSKDQCQYDRR
jgi:hypothetical protein